MKKISLYGMIVFYISAGVNHFWHKELYLRIMPPWVLWQNEAVILSGIGEICFALLLVFSSTRRTAAWCIILLLIAIFPANVQMMLNYWHESNSNLWISIIRLPLQLVLIWWAYSFAKINVIRT
ncbi:MAG: DoxX family protein [Saprospiraceae bacterium]